MNRYLIFTILTFPIFTFSYEVDNFSQRKNYAKIKDSRQVLNDKMNKLIADSVKRSNLDGPCQQFEKNVSLPAIFYLIKNAIDSNPIAEIEGWAERTEDLEKIRAPDENIYSGKSLFAGMIMGVAGLEPSIKLNGHIFGVDKLGHFTAQGFEYFEIAHLEDQGVISALEYGISLEDGRYGLKTTGIKSYGDLGANFSGLKFWENLVGDNGQYIKCVDGKYVVQRMFDWADYVNDSWDQGINCSEFTENIQKTVSKNLKKLGMQCPIENYRCLKIARQECAQYYISPICKDIAKNKINKKCDTRNIFAEEVVDKETVKCTTCHTDDLKMPFDINQIINKLKDETLKHPSDKTQVKDPVIMKIKEQ